MSLSTGLIPQYIKKLHNFVSREAQDIIFHELKQVDNVGTDSSTCGCTLRVTHSLPCACELAKFISVYGSIPLKSIHVHLKLLFIHSSNDLGDSWGDLTFKLEVNALFNRFSQLNVCDKITLKIKVCEIPFLDITSICPIPTKIKTKCTLKSVKSTKREPSMWEHVNDMNTMVDSLETPNVARKVGRDKKKRIIIWMNFLISCKQYILKIVNVTSDENCGYRAIVVCQARMRSLGFSFAPRFDSRTSNMILSVCSIIWLRRTIVGINNFFVC